MVVGPTILTVYQGGVTEQTIGALVVLVPLLSATLAPHLLLCIEVVIDCDLVFLVLVSLLYDALYHGYTLEEVFIAVCSHQDIEGLVFIDLFSVVDAGLALRATATDLNLAMGFFLELLLGLSLGSNDLPDVVN